VTSVMSRGIRISQAGIPVSKAADYQKTMDERWPVLEHQFMGIIRIENYSTDTPGVLNNGTGTLAHIPIYKHSLGYLPAFRLRHISFSGFDAMGQTIAARTFADEQYIWLEVAKNPGAIEISLAAWLAVIDRDCTPEYQAPIDIVTSVQKSNPSQYGLKILNEPTPQGMREKNKSFYSYNTNAKSMLIQQHGIRTASASTLPANSIVIDHRLGYPPTFYVAKRFLQEGVSNPSAGKTVIRSLGTNIGLGKSNSITMTISGAQSILVGDYMFIILKDPVDVAR
jgi:hypothetical protein